MAALRLLLCTALQTCVALSARAACRPCAPQAEPLKWIIVGGGPHGVHIATALLQQVPGVTTANLRIVDDNPELLHAWKTRTRDVGMTHLRSSASNHLDVREDALKKYAESSWYRRGRHVFIKYASIVGRDAHLRRTAVAGGRRGC
ncbi:unnamed protein product [Pelagomonas calceolata]|uniref:FAD-dependent urate hydroxylase HpyO/Asp monooxygenase CreE-like FAD/NAD(P)-binding domain-containing protein n=1 Tax=Pelagomonas calceolata TaxID=35677 RepID=A0A7S4A0R9_9STRA|nr:unnamed protein product [Pelagomonas calceolata]